MNGMTGVPELLSKLANLGTQGERIAKASLNAVADLIVRDAKTNAPSAFGKIRQGIVSYPVNDFLIAVAATAPESPYQEFGTGGKVEVPEAMADIASQFKDAGSGDFKSFIVALVDWIKLRGLTNTYSIATHKVSTQGTDEQNTELAYMIARKILSQGLAPQPFLYPAFVAQSQKLVPMLETALKEMLRSNQK